MSENPPNPQPRVEPRWELTLKPLGDGQGNASITIYAPNVTKGEIVFTLLGVCQQLAASPGERLPTKTEVVAELERQQRAKAHPAKRIYSGKDGVAFLGATALANADLLSKLALAGWLEVGPTPDDLTRGCDYAADPAAFLARLVTDKA